MDAKVSQRIAWNGSSGGFLWAILKDMVSRSVLAASCLAAIFGASSLAQSAPPSTQQNSTSTPVAPAQTTQPKLQLQDLPPDPHTPTPAELEQQRQQQVLQGALRLASVEAHWGPEMDSPGVSLAVTEVKRTKTPEGATQITWQMTGSGFAPNDKLMLVRWPLNSEAQTVMGGLNVDAKGVVVCGASTAARSGLPAIAPGLTRVSLAAAGSQQTPGQAGGVSAPAPNVSPTPPAPAFPPDCSATMQPHQPVEIQATVAPGEAVRVALLTMDRKRGAAASTIPFPLANVDKGCRLQVILGMKNAALVLIDGTGFPANTALTLDAITGDTTRPLHLKTSAEGRIIFPLLAGAKGETSGETTVRFAGVNRPPTLNTPTAAVPPTPDCAPSVTYHWGEGSYKAE